MQVGIFSPYGASSEETGVLGLVGNYVKNMFEQVFVLRCNGIFSLCDRDAESGWRRSVQHCLRCMGEQARLALWANIACDDLSYYLQPEDVMETKRWVTSIPSDELTRVRYGDIEVFGLCERSFHQRCGIEQPDMHNASHEETARRLLLSALRMCLASDKFIHERKPDLMLLAGKDDFITNAFMNRANVRRRDVALFRWDLASRSVRIKHPRRDEEFSCPLVFEDITSMRADTRTWPWELVKIVEDILVFLDLSGSQLSLPIAR